jgi:hypothetical protein
VTDSKTTIETETVRWQFCAQDVKLDWPAYPAIDLPSGAIPAGPPKFVAGGYIIYWWQPEGREIDD